MHPSGRSSLAFWLLVATAVRLEAQTTPSPIAVPVRTLSISMDDAVTMARVRSFRVQRGLRDDKIANLRLATARAQTGPRFDLSANASQAESYYSSRSELFRSHSTDSAFLMDLQASASMPIDIAGVQRRQVQQARLSRAISELELAQTYIDVTAEVRSVYVGALRAQEQVSADEAVVTRIDALITRIGEDKADSKAYLQTERSNATQVLESSRTDAEIVQGDLKQALRLPPETRLILTSRLNDPQSLPKTREILQTAYAHRTDIKQSKLRLEQARLSEKQIADDRKPSLDVTAFANQSIGGPLFRQPYRNRFRSVSAILSLTIPLLQYDGGALGNNRRVSQLEMEQAEADIEERREGVETEIRQALIALTRAQARLGTLPDVAQALAALEHAESAMLAASPGQASALLAQVTNARASWRSAVTSSIDAQTDYYLALYRLQRSMGGEGNFNDPDIAR